MARRSRLTHERRVLLLALLGGVAGVGTTLGQKLSGDKSTALRGTVGGLVVATWLGFAFALQETVG